MTSETGHLSGRISNSNRTPLLGYIPYFRLCLQEEERIKVDTNARDPGKNFGPKFISIKMLFNIQTSS